MKFKPLQEHVAKSYEGGEFAGLTHVSEVLRCGDGLFRFCIIEAGDADDAAEFGVMLERAIKQLESLKADILEDVPA